MAKAPHRPFCELLQEARKRRNLSIKELAERVGISDKAMQHHLYGSVLPSFPMLRALADVLEVSIDFLAGRAPWSDEKFVSIQGPFVPTPLNKLKKSGFYRGARSHNPNRWDRGEEYFGTSSGF